MPARVVQRSSGPLPHKLVLHGGRIMHKQAWFFKSRTVLGILGAMLVFGTLATGCPTESPTPEPEPTTHTVTFNMDGGSAIPDQTVEEGKQVTKPANPTKSGHTFANWYRDVTKTTLWNFDTDVVVKDTTIYAKWVTGENVPSFKVTFDTDGGSTAPAEQSVVKDEPVQRPVNPSKPSYIFEGWYNGDTAWDFSTGVTAAITLKAKWTESVTVTFNTNGGSAITTITDRKGSSVYPSRYQPTKTGHVFDGWYTDEALTTAASSSLTVNANITLYAKWTSTSEIAPYVGVWRNESSSAYLLQDDGTAWYFYQSGYSKTTWSTSKIDGQPGTFNTAKTELTQNSTTYTKNTTDIKTPVAATGALLGVWVSRSSSLELKADKTAVLTSDNGTITLGYCAEANAVSLLEPETNRVIVSFSITSGKLDNFSKQASDSTLAGIWKLTLNGQDYYWNVKADGSGTFHTLGASVPVSITVTEDKKIDGYSYTVSGNKLTLPNNEGFDIVLTKVTSVSGSGYGGDTRLHGTWTATQGSQTVSLTFNSNGVWELSPSQSGIWKADGNNIYLYYPNIGSVGASVMPYTISGSTLTIGEGTNSSEFTKQ
jgi:uncharacterized repeat protein (TIGR02543 family)